MVIKLTPDLEAILNRVALERGVSPEELVTLAIREQLLPKARALEPQDEWERELFAIGTDCGVSLSDEAVSSEGLYED